MRFEADTLVRDFSKFGKTENLEAAGVRENRAIPGHEFVKAAHAADEFVAGAQIQVISVAENDFGAELFKRFVAQAFDRGLRTNRHEERCFDSAVRRSQATPPRVLIRFDDFELEYHFSSLSGEDKRSPNAADHVGSPYGEGNSDCSSDFELARIRGRKPNAD